MSFAVEPTEQHPAKGCEYQTPDEYCAAAKISRATFWRMVKKQKIRVVKFGERCTRVPVRDLQRLAAR